MTMGTAAVRVAMMPPEPEWCRVARLQCASSGVHDFKRLNVWQMAADFAVEIHRASLRFPRSDRGVVGTQLRKAAQSIPANVAEGCGVGSPRETARFYKQASRSACEVENHLIMATRLEYLHPKQSAQYLATIGSIQRMLASLIKRLPDDPRP